MKPLAWTGSKFDHAFPDLPRPLARFDEGPAAYGNNLNFEREHDQGFEKYYDCTPQQRAEAFSQIVQNLSGVGRERAFARGWMNARDKALKRL